MLTKRENIRKQIQKSFFFLLKIQKTSGHMAQGKQGPKFLKEIRAIGSEIIDATDGRTDGRRTNFDFMSPADIIKQS